MRACFFDLDGTLIDSIGLIVTCFQHATETHLGSAITKEKVLQMVGTPLKSYLEALAPGRGEQLIETYREAQYRLHDEMVKPFDGVSDLIQSLCTLEICLGIVTSKGRGGTNKALLLLGDCSSSFKTVVTVDDCLKHKPDPEPLWLAAKNVGCESGEAFYVGDTIYDMQAALAAGMVPVGVTWGVADKKTLLEYTEFVFDDVLSLQEFLLAEIG